MTEAQKLRDSIAKMAKVAANPKTSEATRKALLNTVKIAEAKLKKLEAAEKPTAAQKDSAKELAKKGLKKAEAVAKVNTGKPVPKKVTKSAAMAAAVRLAATYRKKQGLSTAKSDIEKDSVRTALKKGKRTSAAGNTYYEYRENRIDRKPSRYPKLEDGGYVDELGRGDEKFDIHSDSFSDGGIVKHVGYVWDTKDDYDAGKAPSIIVNKVSKRELEETLDKLKKLNPKYHIHHAKKQEKGSGHLYSMGHSHFENYGHGSASHLKKK